jgi:nicotinamide mononucleotide transporter
MSGKGNKTVPVRLTLSKMPSSLPSMPLCAYFCRMNTAEWLGRFAGQMAETPATEWLAAGFGVASVLLARINSVWLYPTGIISTALYTWLFFRPETQLYAEGMLNLYYFSMSVYGWAHWVRRRDRAPLPVTRNNHRDWLITAVIVAAGWLILYGVLTTWTSSDVPAWDAWISATAWAGMWLLARRKVENWVLLNISNICAIPLQLYKQMPLTAMLTLFLFIVAVSGFFSWRKIWREQQAQIRTRQPE